MVNSANTFQSSSGPNSTVTSQGNGVIKKRGAALTGWLLFVIAANLIVALIYLVDGPTLLPAIPLWRIYLLSALGLVNATLGGLLLAWRKWAFYGLCIVAGIVFLLNISNGVSPASALLGLFGLVILYLLLRPKWNLLN